MLFCLIICRNIPIETEYRTTINSDNQIVVFKEQRDGDCIISIEDNEYVCDTVIISNDITIAQVKYVECKTADNFYAQFFFDEMTGFDRFYELYVPASWFNTN